MSWIKGEILNFLHILIVWFKLSCVGLQKQNDQVQTLMAWLYKYTTALWICFRKGVKTLTNQKEAAKVALSYF